MDEPRFAVYVRDWHPPGPDSRGSAGRAGATRTAGRSRASAGRRSIRSRITRWPTTVPARDGASAALRADDRRRGRRARHVVGRRRARPAADRRVQPRLRHGAARAGPRDPRPAASRAARRRRTRRCATGSRGSRDVAPDGTRDAGRRRRVQRRAPRLGARTRRRSSPARTFAPRDRDALHVVGVPEGASHPASRSTTPSGRCSGRRPIR